MICCSVQCEMQRRDVAIGTLGNASLIAHPGKIAAQIHPTAAVMASKNFKNWDDVIVKDESDAKTTTDYYTQWGEKVNIKNK